MCSFKELIENNPSLEEKEITIGKLTFKVKPYLSVEDRTQIMQLAVQEAWEDDHVNDVKMEAYADVFAIIYCTNIEFTDEEKADPIKIYDELQNAGLLEKIIEVLPDYWDYNYAHGLVDAKSGFIGWLNRFAENLPTYVEQLQDTLQNLPPEVLDKINLPQKSED